jgi:hypothetical protein
MFDAPARQVGREMRAHIVAGGIHGNPDNSIPVPLSREVLERTGQ